MVRQRDIAEEKNIEELLSKVVFNEKGLVPVVAQQYDTGQVLMLAWADKDAIKKTVETGFMHYWSRSRNALWKKGETSGHEQKLRKLILDCDGDTLLALVEQKGVACHTNRANCFFNEFTEDGLKINQPVKK